MNIPQHNLRPLPGAAASALIGGGLLFPTTQAGEALVMRRDDEFGLLMGLAIAIPAGIIAWAVVVAVLIALNN